MHQTFKQFLIEDSKKPDLNELAQKLGVSYEDIKKLPLKDLEVILHYVGKHDFSPDSKFDKKELNMGIKVEMEHTNSKIIAKLIAKDHIKEFKDYYTRLKKMEIKANQNRERHTSDFL
jgi:hypothetical protein